MNIWVHIHAQTSYILLLLINYKESLLETGTLPSAGGFAECILSGTRQCQIKYTRQTKTHGKIRLCRVFFSGTRQRCILPSAIFWHSAKYVFAECLFLALGKEAFCRVHFFWPPANYFSKQFLRPKMNSNKNFSTTKLHNFSRSTKFILVISLFDKATITLFIKSTYLSY